MRAFIGVEIQAEFKEKIKQLQEKIAESGADIKFVEPENLHFCLKFLGEVEESKINKIKEVLEKVCAQFEPFEVEISGLGCFPSRNYINAFWLGIKNPQAIIALAELIDSSLAELGFEKEKRPFTPHLTLGRVKTGKNKLELVDMIRQLEKVEIGKMQVKEVKLFESVLKLKGPVYNEIFYIKL